MTPTAELRTRLRKLISEAIPAGMTDADTRFSDTEIDDLLTEGRNIYSAASAGWTMKAALLQQELGQIEQYSIGQENYKKVGLDAAVRSALLVSKQYAAMGRTSAGVILKVTPPGVL